MDLTTVDSLKVGSVLVFGKYSVGEGYDPTPIAWIKATPNNDFITHKVIDYIPFDARESLGDYRYTGNPDYNKSNIRSFLNSEESSWYIAQHPGDNPPLRRHVNNNFDAYASKPGFLYHFEEYEIESIEPKQSNMEETPSFIRLPECKDFYGDEKFPLFKRRGIRANITLEAVMRYGERYGFNTTSFVSFALTDNTGRAGLIRTINRSGKTDTIYASGSIGIRPVCAIKGDTVVYNGNGIFLVKPFISSNICSDNELYNLLGISTEV